MTRDLNEVKHNIIPSLQHTMIYSQAMIGDYKYSARSSDGLGWAVCDGRLLDRTLFAALFEVVGTAFGSTNSTNFRLPDFRGRVPGMIGAGSGLTARALGVNPGEETHTLSVNEMPSHNHTGTTDAAGFNTQVQGITQYTAAPNGGVDAGDNTGSHTHTFTTNNTGGNQAHNNMQPTLFGGSVLIFVGVIPRDVQQS